MTPLNPKVGLHLLRLLIRLMENWGYKKHVIVKTGRNLSDVDP